jgi:hypothetical protein
MDVKLVLKLVVLVKFELRLVMLLLKSMLFVLKQVGVVYARIEAM